MSLGLRIARVAVAADDQGQVAGPGDDVGRPGDQGVQEAGAGGLHFDGGAVQLQPILHQARRRGKRHVRGERGQHQQVDVARLQPAVGQAARAGLLAQVAGGLVRQRVPALEDARPLDDPVRIEAKALVQVFVGDNGIRNVAACAEHTDSPQAATARTR